MQIITILKKFKEFFASKVVLSANHLYPENIQRLFSLKTVFDANHHHPENIRRLFRLQYCGRCKPSLSWKYSKNFSPVNLSQPQIIIIPKRFKEIFACKIASDASHHYPENIQKLFPLQYCLRCKSSLSWNYSKNFSPAILSQPQITFILETFKHFFACKNVLAANHHYPENIQKLFRLQNCLRRKSSLYWKYSKSFSAANFS